MFLEKKIICSDGEGKQREETTPRVLHNILGGREANVKGVPILPNLGGGFPPIKKETLALTMNYKSHLASQTETLPKHGFYMDNSCVDTEKVS